jgi:transcriptional regulator NrdR family protein
MNCPTCGSSRNKVLDSRNVDRESRRRRRECVVCDRKWTTYETNMANVDAMNKKLSSLKSHVQKILREFSKISIPIEATDDYSI